MPQVLNLEVHALLPADAEVISQWRYWGPYALYDGPTGRESESARYMLEPRNGFHAVRGASGLVGFCSFGVDGRVPGGTYDDDVLDVGAGMDPALVGNGHGRAFLGVVVEYATRKLNALRLRATVASWNERALRASSSVGFHPISTFRTDRGIEFTILLRETRDDTGLSPSVGFLADHEEALPIISQWLVREWGDRQSSTAVDEFAESLRSRMNRDRIPLQLVALVGQRVVGIAMLKKHELRAVHPELTNWLGSVFVDPQFRGRRIASLLTERAAELARGLDIRRLHLQTEDLSGGLYARLGWKPLHRVEYEGVQRLIMLKDLAAMNEYRR